MDLLTVGNPKTIKGEKQGYLTFILHLAPSDLSGYQTCPKATVGCKLACLNTAGRGGMFPEGGTNTIQEARKRKTRMFFERRDEFMELLVKDIKRGIKYAQKKDLIPVFRLNGTSDIGWEKIRAGDARNVMELFPTIQFYDYTKIVGRKNIPANYHLTFSKADGNELDVRLAVSSGMNVAVVFSTKTLPETYINRSVFNGDESDLRFLDPKNVIVGLYAKGRAKKDSSGFVVQL
jgi:hypothetical protein